MIESMIRNDWFLAFLYYAKTVTSIENFVGHPNSPHGYDRCSIYYKIFESLLYNLVDM